MTRTDLNLSAERKELLGYTPVFEWKTEYDLGLPIIDSQHRGLAAAINSLHFAAVNNLGDKMLEPTIEMVKAYAGVHFMTEEHIFTQCGYQDAERHKGLHHKLVDTLFEVGQESLFTQDPWAFIHFLKSWLITHILKEDRSYRDYFRSLTGGDAGGS